LLVKSSVRERRDQLPAGLSQTQVAGRDARDSSPGRLIAKIRDRYANPMQHSGCSTGDATMEITTSGRTALGPEDRFTGAAYVDGLRDPDARSSVSCAHVRFTPGARTAWHTHPKGQTIYVTDGVGWVATRADGKREIRPGDVVHIEPNEEHWHGATPDRFMAHVVVQEADEHGEVVTWLDHVTDYDYIQTR